MSPFFQSVLQSQMMDSQNKKIALPDEEPEIFSSVLEYLYKGDYYPRLVHNKKRNSWELEQTMDEGQQAESTVYQHCSEGELLKDTVIYCAAEKYGLEELKRVALRKQGLRQYPDRPPPFPTVRATNIAQSRESKPARSSRRLGMPMPTPPTQTRS